MLNDSGIIFVDDRGQYMLAGCEFRGDNRHNRREYSCESSTSMHFVVRDGDSATAAVGWVSGFPTDQLTADDIERICENYRSDPTYVLKYFNEVGTEVR